MKSPKQLEALQAATQKKKQETFDKVLQAIVKLTQQGQCINIPTVAKSAGVSTVYLYKHSDLKNRIKELQAKQEKTQPPSKQPQPASHKSQANLVSQLRQEVIKLRNLNVELKEQIEVAYGQLAQFHELKDENQRLKNDLQQAMDLLDQYREQSKDLLSIVEKEENTLPYGNVTSIHQKRKQNLTTALSDVISLGLKSIRISKPTRQIIELIGFKTEQEVLESIAVVKEAIEAGTVRNPARYFVSALQHGWTPNVLDELQQVSPDFKQVTQWFDLARAKGVVLASTKVEGKIMVYGIDGEAKPFSWWLEQYPIQDLMS